MKVIIMAIIAALIIAVPIAILEHNYKNPENDLEYCLRNKPVNNYTNSREGVCFTTEWPKYCDVIAPHLCPNVSATDRVIHGINPLLY
jgi:hypothetical protein